MESVATSPYHIVAPLGVLHYHMMLLAAHSHLHNQPSHHSSKHRHRSMYRFPAGLSLFSGSVGRGPSGLDRNAHSH